MPDGLQYDGRRYGLCFRLQTRDNDGRRGFCDSRRAMMRFTKRHPLKERL
jgi:hypothetical protein